MDLSFKTFSPPLFGAGISGTRPFSALRSAVQQIQAARCFLGFTAPPVLTPFES